MPFCIKCGTTQSDKDLFCSLCGLPSHGPATQPHATAYAAPKGTPPQYGSASRMAFLPKSDFAAGGALVAIGIIAMIATGSCHSGSSHFDDSPTHAAASESSTATGLDRSGSDRLSYDERTERPSLRENSPDSARDAIRTVMLKDSSAGEKIKARLDSLSENDSADQRVDKLVAALNDYAATAREISLSECPDDFREAYYRSVSAWSEAADLIENRPHLPTEDEAKLEVMSVELADYATATSHEDPVVCSLLALPCS